MSSRVNRKNHIIIDEIEHKWCPTCKNYWPLVAYRRNASRVDGLHPYCRKCDKAEKARAKDSAATRRRHKRAKQIRRARQRGCAVYTITLKDMIRLLNTPCRYKNEHCVGPMTMEHIVPLSRGGSHGIGNLTILCAYHNSSKNNSTHMEYRLRMAQLDRMAQPVLPSDKTGVQKPETD